MANNNRLFVGNLPWSISNEQLQELFAEAGNVVSANIITDRYSGKSKGYGFVEFETEEEAKKAVELFNNREIDGRQINVDIARPPKEG